MLKKTSLFLILGMVVLAAFPSCTKDKAGVYLPKKKIQRMYGASSYTNKYLRNIWIWDDNLLKTIDHYSSSGGLSWTEYFSYDGKRLTRVDDYSNSEYVLYDYDGNNLKSASYYYRNNIGGVATVTYSDNKISKISQTFYDSKKDAKTLCHLDPLSVLFPAHLCEVMEKSEKVFAASRLGKEIYTINWQFTWTDDNITKLFATDSEGHSISVAFQYDSKNSVLKGFMDLYSLIDDDVDSYVGLGCYSKNNVTKMIYTYSDGDTEIINLIYQYDKDDYPTMITESYDGGTGTYMTYYEYE